MLWEFSHVTRGRFCADVKNSTIGFNVKFDADVKKTTARHPTCKLPESLQWAL